MRAIHDSEASGKTISVIGLPDELALRIDILMVGCAFVLTEDRRRVPPQQVRLRAGAWVTLLGAPVVPVELRPCYPKYPQPEAVLPHSSFRSWLEAKP